MPELILDVVTEDPEKEHVAADVEDVAVEEHVGNERMGSERAIVQQSRRHQPPSADEGLRIDRRQPLQHKDRNASPDQRIVDNRPAAAAEVLIANREHRSSVSVRVPTLSIGGIASRTDGSTRRLL